MGDTSFDQGVVVNDMWSALQQLQEENNNLRHAFEQLQASTSRPPGPAVTVTTPVPQATKEPRIGLPDKFDGTRSKFRGFVNQIRLIIRMQPLRYPTEETQVGLIGTLLSGTALSWFSPLVEKDSPLLQDFGGFLEEFTNTFGETDKERTATTKIRSLQQRSRAASVYAAEFRQLACDVDWDDKALTSAFRWGLRDDVKDLLLNLADPTTLSEAITQAVRCDNRLFERRQERRSLSGPYRVDTATPTRQTHASMPEPMQIDASKVLKLSQEEKDRRRKEDLCLYCGEKGHRAHNCHKKTSISKPHKFRYTSADRSMVKEVEEQENDDTQPQ